MSIEDNLIRKLLSSRDSKYLNNPQLPNLDRSANLLDLHIEFFIASLNDAALERGRIFAVAGQ